VAELDLFIPTYWTYKVCRIKESAIVSRTDFHYPKEIKCNAKKYTTFVWWKTEHFLTILKKTSVMQIYTIFDRSRP
jgi:hypothetical protein